MPHSHLLEEITSVIYSNVKSSFELKINTDSRNFKTGETFVALVGEKFDGFNYVEDVLKQCDFALDQPANTSSAMNLGEAKDIRSISRKITIAENLGTVETADLGVDTGSVPVLGITGTGGAGKSSVTDEIVRRYLNNYTDKTIAVFQVFLVY